MTSCRGTCARALAGLPPLDDVTDTADRRRLLKHEGLASLLSHSEGSAFVEAALRDEGVAALTIAQLWQMRSECTNRLAEAVVKPAPAYPGEPSAIKAALDCRLRVDRVVNRMTSTILQAAAGVVARLDTGAAIGPDEAVPTALMAVAVGGSPTDAWRRRSPEDVALLLRDPDALRTLRAAFRSAEPYQRSAALTSGLTQSPSASGFVSAVLAGDGDAVGQTACRALVRGIVNAQAPFDLPSMRRIHDYGCALTEDDEASVIIPFPVAVARGAFVVERLATVVGGRVVSLAEGPMEAADCTHESRQFPLFRCEREIAGRRVELRCALKHAWDAIDTSTGASPAVRSSAAALRGVTDADWPEIRRILATP